ncbi:class I SAM-dependent methyltransferase [Frigidibacter oleivorans]|uniref:class I SAM-dependent methyltransferase n=1 Tax=Frigidibacter oleivorans TaxID=2487129 RepID=UPI00197ACC5D|nr:hypothetical protein [Frigidibacter oleivorans]
MSHHPPPPPLGPAAFLAAFLRSPRRIASALPSGAALSDIMVRDIPLGVPILELGAGTGVFTRAMLHQGVAEADLTLIERHPGFARRLAACHPRARVLDGDAARLGRHLAKGDVAAAISGLPLLSMSTATKFRILASVFGALCRDGALYQFTYGPRAPVPAAMLKRLGLVAEEVGFTWRNLPPARVYRLSRRQAPAAGHAPATAPGAEERRDAA